MSVLLGTRVVAVCVAAGLVMPARAETVPVRVEAAASSVAAETPTPSASPTSTPAPAVPTSPTPAGTAASTPTSTTADVPSAAPSTPVRPKRVVSRRPPPALILVPVLVPLALPLTVPTTLPRKREAAPRADPAQPEGPRSHP